MRTAQRLYEGVEIGGETVGLITYMRTDGVSMDGGAIAEARAVIGNEHGDEYVPEKPRFYSSKAKNAQEAHEAIRPTSFRAPRDAAGSRPGPALCADLEARGGQPDGKRPAGAHHHRL
jgi:DNA topoisomerase-1